jgi:hypothetical protein
MFPTSLCTLMREGPSVYKYILYAVCLVAFHMARLILEK